MVKVTDSTLSLSSLPCASVTGGSRSTIRFSTSHRESRVGVAALTSEGSWMVIAVVEAPSQPWATLNSRTANAPAAVVEGVTVTCADAGAASPSTTRPAAAQAAPARGSKPAMGCRSRPATLVVAVGPVVSSVFTGAS